ncbi:tetratricopeptide repeat protein [Alkalimonas delamerensis]|uniref:Ancillary SecYEG translocon subunit n=1 Tax=Alkalimonas delamerensis TaxID=265981 RepID=A0ABT9GLS8_9GAMM|nr:tetratricopeptide repeat protein [Alkalimonas delamerensis]MDP4527923.1 tetratricopeptide repeat protein [Alkalimonas delamerensis]
MDVYSNEEQQVEAIKRFWKEYGITIVAGTILGLGGLYGFRYYQGHQLAQAEQASANFEQLLLAQEQSSDWHQDVEGYIDQHDGTAYATFAALLKARDAVLAGDFELAEQQLSRVIASTKDPVIDAIARLRLARVHLQQQQYDAGLALLASTLPDSFQGQQQELKGDILLAQGDAKAAKQAFLLAKASSGVEAGQLLKIKLDELAHIQVEERL